MKERQPTNQDRISVLRHPILSTRLFVVDRRITASEKTYKQADRIIGLPQAPDSAKAEATTNRSRSQAKLTYLHEVREDILNRGQRRRGNHSPTDRNRLWTVGDDVFGGHDLNTESGPEYFGGKYAKRLEEIENINQKLDRLDKVILGWGTTEPQRVKTEHKCQRLVVRRNQLIALQVNSRS